MTDLVPVRRALISLSDKSGLNKRREIERMDKKKADRRQENLASLGLDTRSRRKGAKR